MTTPKFFPRPEAHPMKWDALLPPLRRAVRDLLVRIDGATSKDVKKGEVVAKCFLIYGERGTGKTTVLLSAKYACEQANVFFPDDKNDDDTDSNSKPAKGGAAPEDQKTGADNLAHGLLKDARMASDIHNVVWLDVLDLEPLSSCANLLATVLTRVRNALCQSGSGKDEPEFTSILEDGSGRSDSARQKFGQLISDAAMMWQEVDESDTRSRANRHVDAADKYAGYKEQFQEAMKTLSAELARRKGNRNECFRIILPIDNIDRSAEHLYSIVKLAQMVSCPYLWLVLAGDRQDIDSLLERAYWKELIRVGHGAGGVGKEDSGGEDETLVMARRQAAAASHKLLPPSHRVQVELVKPEDTLQFYPTDDSALASKSIKNMLTTIRVTEKKEDQPVIHLVDLFYAENLIYPARANRTKKTDIFLPEYLTSAGKLGLHLPARGVLDLWQLACWVVEDDMIGAAHRAEKLTRTMLRNSIAESGMSNKMGRIMQEKIIVRHAPEGTVLDFSSHGFNLKPCHLSSLYFEFFSQRKKAIPQKEGTDSVELEVRSKLSVRRGRAMNMVLESRQTIEEQQYQQYQQNQQTQEKQQSNKINKADQIYQNDDDVLPDIVAGWLSALYDVVIWGPDDLMVFSNDGLEWHSPCVEYQCDVGLPEGSDTLKYWPMPMWDTFIENDVCGKLWRDFIIFIKDKNLLDEASRAACLPHLLATGWVACALQTFLFFAQKEYKLDRSIFRRGCMAWIRAKKMNQPLSEIIADIEKNVLMSASDVYDKISIKRDAGEECEPVWMAENRMLPIRDWLENELPLMLLTDTYVPLVGDLRARAETVFETLEETNLAHRWQTDLDNGKQRKTYAWRMPDDSMRRAGH